MKLQVNANLSQACVRFLLSKLTQFHTGKLEYFRLYDRTGQTKCVGVWGRCTYPNRKQNLGYRVRCSVSIKPDQFPYPAKWAIGTIGIDRPDEATWDWTWREDKFHTREEAFVWTAGHEAFHWLRHSRQIPGANYETQANQFGFDWLDAWRVELAKERKGET